MTPYSSGSSRVEMNLPIGGRCLLTWCSDNFLGTITSQDLKFELNISSLTKKAQQRMYFLHRWKKIQAAKVNGDAVLLLHHLIYPHFLHHHLVRYCHYQAQRQTAAYHPLHWRGDWLQSPFPTRPVHPPGHWIRQTRLLQDAVVNHNQHLTPQGQFLSPAMLDYLTTPLQSAYCSVNMLQ